jgi:putative ABC transport system substrate-binding protein
MQRRKFITLIGSTAVGWPLSARAQQAGGPVIGWLGSTSPQPQHVLPFVQGLNADGYIEGQNLAIEYRWANGNYGRMPAFAAEFVEKRVVLIAAQTSAAALAAKAATDTVPTVFMSGSDPVQLGLVVSMNRPGGNRTGVNLVTHTLDAKRLQLLRELVPTVTTIATLLNPNNPSAESNKTSLQAAARTLGLQVDVIEVASANDLAAAFAVLAQTRPNALVVGADSLLHSLSNPIIKFAADHGIPAVYEWREHVESGGLISYGTNLPDAFRQLGTYAARILRGTKPGDLPVLEPTRFELAINVRTARALGITVPPTLLAIADEVIE